MPDSKSTAPGRSRARDDRRTQEDGRLADLRLRIGVHSGSVIGGVIGNRKFAFDIWGETVNIASRLESQGVGGRVHVSAATRRSVADLFDAEPRGPIQLRGYGSMETTRSSGAAARTSRPHKQSRGPRMSEMHAFVPGLELSRRFYIDVVAGLLGNTRHSAARLGEGSEVLGFDTVRSTDHGWGPRLQLFVEPGETGAVAAMLDRELPDTFLGWPTRFGWDDVAVSHHVEINTVDGWLDRRLGLGRPADLSPIDWLATPQQLLLEATAGEVFHDGLGELDPVRDSLAWYPDDVWLWMLACQWQRIGQEEAFVGRTAEVGDELGSRLVAGRLARDLIRLCFLLERRYAPYTKWLGSAFAQLEAGASVGPALERAVDAREFEPRERALAEAYEMIAARHNRLGLTEQVDPTVRPFYGRPFLVIEATRFVDASLARVDDHLLRSLPLVGGIDQFSDSTDMAAPQAARAARVFLDQLVAAHREPKPSPTS